MIAPHPEVTDIIDYLECAPYYIQALKADTAKEMIIRARSKVDYLTKLLPENYDTSILFERFARSLANTGNRKLVRMELLVAYLGFFSRFPSKPLDTFLSDLPAAIRADAMEHELIQAAQIFIRVRPFESDHLGG